MIDPVQELFAAGFLTRTLFSPTSRYYSVPTAQLVQPDGAVIVHLRRRFVPPPEAFSTIREHRVVEGERLDRIAAAELGDPEQFWQICDANGAMVPNDLVRKPGSRIRITLPAGVPGPSEAEP